MSKTTDLPGDSLFGLEFNYATWSANTTVTMANVPWSSDYRDIVQFANRAALDSYITANAGPTFTQMTRCNVNVPVRVPRPFNECYNYNYLRVSNGAQASIGSAEDVFYYFVHDVRYVSGNVTELIVQLDVWQTFGRGVTFGNCYIERGHIGVANENQMLNNGRNYLTVPEGLDLGGDHVIVSNVSQPFTADTTGASRYSILLASNIDLSRDTGTVAKPKITNSSGGRFDGLPSSCNYYLFETVSSLQSMLALLKDKPWVTQGIISIMAVPKMSSDDFSDAVQLVIAATPDDPMLPTVLTPVADAYRLPGYGTTSIAGGGAIAPRDVVLQVNFRNSILGMLAGRYGNLKKFLTYPYSAVELTTYSGNPLLLKPELISGDDFGVKILTQLALPSPRIMAYPLRYNAGPYSSSSMSGGYDDGGEALDLATGITNFPGFTTLNNGYLTTMASSAATIAYQHQSADWSQQRALTGNQTSFDQSSVGIATSENLTEIGIRGNTQTTALNNEFGGYRAAQSAITGIGTGAMGGPAGIAGSAVSAAGGAMSHALNVSQSNQQLGISSGTSRAQTAAQMNQQSYNRDTNKNYADYAAKGDYQNAIGAINAKVQDAKLVQPTTSGQLGGSAFNLINGGWRLYVKVKLLEPAALAAVGEYWLRYGYQINRFATPPASLMVMENFTYWKMKETYLRSTSCPESFRMTIRGIFEKGVTVWANPANIGILDIANNPPKTGIVL